MDRLHDFLNYVKDKKLAQGNFLGLLHVLIGRTVEAGNGEPVSKGVTWRELAAWLQKVRWDKDAVRELGLDPEELPPKDRQRFWFLAFSRANLDTPRAAQAGDRLAHKLRAEGYQVGTGPKA